MKSSIPAAAGVGLRFPHHGAALHPTAGVAWLEVHPENYLMDAGARVHLRRARERLPLSLHAVGLSLGSVGGVDEESLGLLREFAAEFQPGLVSDHLSFSVANGHYLPDLLPLPYTTAALSVVVRNVQQVQEALGRQLLLENPSVYLLPSAADYDEAGFFAELVRRTGCGVLLDVNNIHVSAVNTGQTPAACLRRLLDAVPHSTIGEIHLAGHSERALPNGGHLLIDDHGSRVVEDVWLLYREAVRRLGAVPTLIEWDTGIPAWEVLANEAVRAQTILGELS